jgi:hypothetical protein
MAGIHAWSATAGSNTSVAGVGINTGMSPANVDNAMRAIMAEVKVSFAAGLESFFNGTASLPVASGGTGAATAALARTSLGALADTFKGIPMTAKSSAFAFAIADEGVGCRYTGAAAAATINPVATTAYTVGAVIPVRNAHNATGALTLTRGLGVALRIAGQTTDQNITLAVGGYGVLVHEASDVWFFSGVGAS